MEKPKGQKETDDLQELQAWIKSEQDSAGQVYQIIVKSLPRNEEIREVKI